MKPKINNNLPFKKHTYRPNPERRKFLKTACVLTGGLVVGGLPVPGKSNMYDKKLEDTSIPSPMPKIQIGSHLISRLVLGSNPVWGYSYQGKLLSKFMVNYFTDDNIVKLLHQSEGAGITTWQAGFQKRLPDVWKRYQDEGGKMNLIILHSFNEISIKEIASLNPIAIVHHGGVSDRLLVSGKFQRIRDFVKEVKDVGVMAGVSCHKPEVIEKISEEDWENDLFMACFYEMTRSPSEWEKMLGFTPFQYIFHDNDPKRMCRTIRSTGKPVLGFKILAGGWAGDRKELTEQAFKFAFQNIKASDGVIVGILPAFDDQVSENVKYTIKYGRNV